MKAINPCGIDFGSNEGAKDALDRYFFDSGIYSKLANTRKTIIVGRKGSGKTAIAYHALDQARQKYNDFAAVLSFREIPYSILESFQDPDFTESSRFIQLWRFIILIELAKLVIKNESLHPDKERKISAIISAVAPGLEISPEGYLKKTKSNEFKINLPKFFSKKSTEIMQYEQVNLLDYVSQLEAEVVASAQIGCNYTVILDELDDSYAENATYSNLLISMFKATNDLNIKFGRAHTGLQVLVALRSDIYDSLRYSDKNKWEDATVRIEWIPDPAESATQTDLFKMINLRIGASFEAVPRKKYNYWDLVFESNPVYADLRSFQYILSRTFYRPRDVIQYCKCIQEAAPKDVKKYNAKHVLAAEMAFSEWLKRELKDEMGVVLPEIIDVLESLKQLTSPIFVLDDVIDPLSKIDYSSKRSVKEVLAILFDFSVIGCFDDDKDQSQNAPRFRFRNPDRKFDPTKKLAIHYGLRSCLRFSVNDMRVRRGAAARKRQ